MLGTRVLSLPKEWPSMTPAEMSTIRSVGVTGTLQKASCKGSAGCSWVSLEPFCFCEVKAEEMGQSCHWSHYSSGSERRPLKQAKLHNLAVAAVWGLQCSLSSQQFCLGGDRTSTTRIGRTDLRLQEETCFSWGRDRQQTCVQNTCSGGAPPAASGWAAEGSKKGA